MKTEGDIGQALEMLLSDCFDLGLKIETKSAKGNEDRDFIAEGEGEEDAETQQHVEELSEEIVELRAEEITVLESIYGSAFSERIAGRVWVLGLNLPHLDALAESHDITAASKVKRENVVDDREVCRFYMRGSCKFGANRCRYKHDSPFKTTEQLESYKTANPDDDSFMYELEVRFPPGNKYPLESPVVAFATRSKVLPYSVCLNIARRLLVNARELSESQSPVVFPLVSMLDNEDELTRLFKERPMPFSNPPPVVNSKKAILAEPAPIEVIKNVPTKKEKKVPEATVEKTADYDDDENYDTNNDGGKHETMREKYGRGRKNVLPRTVTPREAQRIGSRAVEQFKRKQVSLFPFLR